MSASKPIAYNFREAEAKIKSRDEQIELLLRQADELRSEYIKKCAECTAWKHECERLTLVVAKMDLEDGMVSVNMAAKYKGQRERTAIERSKTMGELIERKAAMAICQREYDRRLKTLEWYGGAVARDIAEELEYLPTVDAVPVVHGYWEWFSNRTENLFYGCDDEYGYRCSKCKAFAENYGVYGDIFEEPPIALHFCPNCGAKMDIKEQNND